MWLHERQQNSIKLKELTHVMSQQLAIRVENWVKARETVVSLLAKSWTIEYAHNVAKFKRDAQNILNTYPGFQAINWIDSTWTIKIVTPEEPNRLALGKNLHKHPFPTVQEALNKAIRTGSLSCTSPIHLLQGGNGFVTYFPVFSENHKILGFLNVVFRIDTLIQYCLNDPYVNSHFNYVVYSNKIQPIFWKGNIPQSVIDANKYKASALAKIIDQKWLITLFPKKSFITAEISPSNNRFFFFNLIFSFTIAFLIWIFILRSRRLKQSEEHFRTLFDSANTWIHILGFDGTILDVNQAFLSAFSLSKQTVLKKNFFYFLMPESKTLFKTILATIKQNLQFQTELKIKGPNGGIRYLDCFGSIVRDKRQKPQFIILHSIDITQRKYYQNKLNESEEKYRVLSEQSLTGVYLIRDGLLNYTNPKFAQIFGFDATQKFEQSKSIGEFIVPEDRPRIENSINALIEGRQKEMHLELTGKRKDGSTVALEAFGHRILFNGKPAILGTFIDISEQKKHLQTIRKLSKAIEQSPTAMLITDKSGTVEYVNPAFTQITGYRLEELKGKHARHIKIANFSEELLEDVKATIRSGKIWQGELSGKRKNQQPFWQRITISPLKDNNGKTTHFLTNIEDITDRKKLEDELLQKQKMEAIGRLAGGIAHDFNNLLTVINGYSQLILHSMPSDNPLYPKIEQIFQAGERAKNLTSQLLAFSRKQIRQPSPLNLTTLVHNIEKMLTRLIGEDITIVCELAENLWPIESDKNQIEQIILNLAINARQAMPDGGKIIIKTENFIPDKSLLNKYPEIKKGKYVRLSVIDNGIGMDEETQKHIFEPFFTTKPVGQGTGLGLATVYGIVKQNDGYIYVESAPKAGSTFCIYFPAIETNKKNSEQNIQSIYGAKLKGTETIFLVEDDPSVRELTLRSLHYFGYKVIVASNGEEALEKFNKNNLQVDLLITDVIMPGIGGKKLVDFIRKKKPNLRVLFMSGYTEDQISQKGVLNSEINFIQKPFAPVDLVKRIRQILDLT